MSEQGPAAKRPASQKWIVLGSLILVPVTLWFAGQVFGTLAAQKEEPPREEPIPAVYRVETFLVESRPLQRFIAAFGTAQANREVMVAAEVAGRITETQQLRVGDTVQGPNIALDADGKSQRSTGSTILRIDPQTYEERVKQAQNLVSQDAVELQQMQQEEGTNTRLRTQQQERLATSQKELDRARNLLAQQAGRESDVSQAELAVQQFQEVLIRLENERDLFPIRRQQLESKASTHKSDLALAMLELEKAHVRAPFGGTLSEVLVEEGQYVRPGEPIAKITDAERVEVPIPVNLTDAAVISRMLAAGTEPVAELVPDEAGLFQSDGVKWAGVVQRVSPVADERTRTINVFVEVDNRGSAAPLRPGTFVFARIKAEVLSAEEGFLIPRDALLRDKLYVTAPDADTPVSEQLQKPRLAKSIPVEVIRTMQSFVLVQGPLQSGDEVVMTNLDIISEGVHLDVRETHAFAEELARLKVGYIAAAEPSAATEPAAAGE